MTNYTKGRSLEYRVIDILKGLGYSTIRSAGSHGPCDILAARWSVINNINDRQILAIQVKRQKDLPLSMEEKINLVSFAKVFNAIPVYVNQKEPRKPLSWYTIRDNYFVALDKAYLTKPI